MSDPVKKMRTSVLFLRIFLGVVAGAVGLVLALLIVARGHAYKGPVADPGVWDPNADRGKVVAEGRRLVGVWYDPLQGYFNNLGGRFGFIVCMDVPVIAYRNAGTSIRKLLETDYAAHPEHYKKSDGRPGDPYFERRARNLYTYCKFNGCLDMQGPPAPGDVVFMSHSAAGGIAHIALVSSVEPDGRYRVVESSPYNGYTTAEMDGETMLDEGWLFRGYGRPLKH